MPLEISEIGVRIAVQDPADGSAVVGGRGGPGQPDGLSPSQLQDIVNQCVRDVLRTLRMLEAR
jgi:hypothetical protein